MSWRVEWKALSNRIYGLLEAGRFYLESKSIRSDDPYGVAKKHLMPQAQDIFNAIETLRNTYQTTIPIIAYRCLDDFVKEFHSHFIDSQMDQQAAVQFRISTLASFSSEFTYHLSDLSAYAKRLSERAFLHLQRTIVADDIERQKWKETFKQGEPACEKLGATHLLLHGIWAFKINAKGEQTDLVFGEPILNLDEIERSSEALVLTEWKRAVTSSEVNRKIADAKGQASRYASGSLGGLELAQYRYIVIVTKKVEQMPIDDHVSDIIYRHINIAVDPDIPSKK